MKQDLFLEEEEETSIPYNTQNSREKWLDLELTLDEVLTVFEKNGLKEQIRCLLDHLFECADSDPTSVTQVRVFGGSSRIRYFREILAEYFGEEEVSVLYDPEESYGAVAVGAARYLGMLERENSGGQFRIQNRIPYHVGIAREGKLDCVIRQNEKYGQYSSRRRPFFRGDLEKAGWVIPLYQSFEREDVPIEGEDGAIYMGRLVLDPSRYEGAEKISCRFMVNDLGKLTAECQVRESDGSLSTRERKEILIGE